MLTQLSITGFRCFRQLDVELKPLTVLIGPNDTGKSTFLRAIQLLGRVEPTPTDFRQQGDVPTMVIRGHDSSGVYELIGERKGNSFRRSKILENVSRFQLPISGVTTQCQGLDENETKALLMKSDGSNVASILDYFLRKDRKRFFAIVDAMKSAVPGLEELDIDTPNPAQRRIDLVADSGCKLPANEASAGVRLLMFFMTLLHHPKPPDVILIEEPENGIHPKRLGEVMRILREVSQGRYGRVAQVIVTTHSPYLVDYVNLEEDQLLVFQRSEDGSRTAKPVNRERLKEFFEGFLPGEILFNEEEAGFVREAS